MPRFADRPCMSLKALEPASPLSNLSGERISPARKRASSRTLRSKFSRLPGPPLRSGRFAALAVMRDALRSLSAEPSQGGPATQAKGDRSEEHTSELQSLMRISYAVFRLKKK